MPGKSSKSKNSEGSTIHAAIVARKGQIWATIISGIFLVIVATITSNWWGKWVFSPPKSFVISVRNKDTEKAVSRATIRLESEGVPPKTQISDTNGIAQFRVDDPKKEVHIWIEANGFEGVNLRVIPSDIDVRLNPMKNIIPAVSPPLEESPPGKSTSQKGTGPKVTGTTPKPAQREEVKPEEKDSASKFSENLNKAKAFFRMERWERAAYYFNEASKYVDESQVEVSKLITAKSHYEHKGYRDAARTFNELFSKF